MNKDIFSRRKFLGLSAVAAGSLATKTIWLDPDPLWAMPQAVAASDRVRFGIIGIGMQGSGLLANSIELPGVECVAACDLYDGRHTLSKEIVNNPSLPTTRRYQELLANKGIDCLIAAVPDHWHKQVVVDAVSAGKDIYCEKPMSHTPADGVAMVDATKKTGDRKSTRLNSSHGYISYAVFCLKKKKKRQIRPCEKHRQSPHAA